MFALSAPSAPFGAGKCTNAPSTALLLSPREVNAAIRARVISCAESSEAFRSPTSSVI